jgi:hypothetical protein
MRYCVGVVLAVVVFFSRPVWADAGVFTGTGQNLRQISTQAIQLVSIDVTITLGRGPRLFDTGTGGMDEVAYDCKFLLKNLTDKAANVQVGFPIDSQFAKLPPKAPRAEDDWVGDYSFNARDEKSTYHVSFQRKDPPNEHEPYSAIFTWIMSLEPKESRTLTVQYRIPMSMTLAGTDKPSDGPPMALQEHPEHPWVALIATSVVELAGYTTETGSSWSGNVETATFTVITQPFEEYLHYRGLNEIDSPEQRKATAEHFPVQHVWVFRDIRPSGWQPVEQGIQWQYKDFKPKDPVTVAYFLMQFPQDRSDVDSWVDAILRTIPDRRQQAGELAMVRQILLATYGQEPSDQAARSFVETQIWYAPRKDFATAKLSEEQQAVLAGLDRRLAALKQGAQP